MNAEARSAEEIADEFGLDLSTARALAAQESAKGLAIGPNVPNVFVLVRQISSAVGKAVHRRPLLSALLFSAVLALVVALDYHGSLLFQGRPLTPWLAELQPWTAPLQTFFILLVYPCLSAAMDRAKFVLWGGVMVGVLVPASVIASDRLFYGPIEITPKFVAAYAAYGLACLVTGFTGLLLKVRISQNLSREKLDRLSALSRLQILRQQLRSNAASGRVLPYAWYVTALGAPLIAFCYVITKSEAYCGTGAILVALAVGMLSRNWKETIIAGMLGASFVFLICVQGIPPQVRNLIPGFITLSVIFAAGTFIAAGGVAGARQKAIDKGDRLAIVQEILRLERQVLDARTRSCCVMVIDASKSSEMKLGSDPLLAELAFRQYQAWIDEIVEPFHGQILSRPGDGAIVSFDQSASALAAAEALLKSLERFNSERNGLTKPFRLRVGLHTGQVSGNVVDVQFTAVIDVAAHVEAKAPLNGIALTQPCLHDLGLNRDLQATCEVDGYPVYVWEPIAVEA